MAISCCTPLLAMNCRSFTLAALFLPKAFTPHSQPPVQVALAFLPKAGSAATPTSPLTRVGWGLLPWKCAQA